MDVRSPGPSTDVPGTMSRILRVADDVMAYLWTTRSDNSASFPAVGCAYEISCDSLKFVYFMASAFRTFSELFTGIFITAFHAPVPVVVNRAVANVV